MAIFMRAALELALVRNCTFDYTFLGQIFIN